MTAPSFAAILAGGQSRRFGSPKALAPVAGVRLLERVVAAARGAAGEAVLITDRPDLYAGLALRARADERPGNGPLGGVHAALRWAREEGRPGALCLACDLPFLAAALLSHLLRESLAGGAAAVVPEGPRGSGIEPLCAWYSVSLLPDVEARLARGDLSLTALVSAASARRLPLHAVREYGDPDTLFLNVNTPADHAHARECADVPAPRR